MLRGARRRLRLRGVGRRPGPRSDARAAARRPRRDSAGARTARRGDWRLDRERSAARIAVSRFSWPLTGRTGVRAEPGDARVRGRVRGRRRRGDVGDAARPVTRRAQAAGRGDHKSQTSLETLEAARVTRAMRRRQRVWRGRNRGCDDDCLLALQWQAVFGGAADGENLGDRRSNPGVCSNL